jgi:hypothetical protein
MKKKDANIQIAPFKLSEAYQVGMIVKSISDYIQQGEDMIDLIVKDRSVHISDNRGAIAKDMLRGVKTTMLAYQDPVRIGKLADKDIQRILQMVDDLLKGKREAVHLQLNRNCDGLKELISNYEIKLKL